MQGTIFQWPQRPLEQSPNNLLSAFFAEPSEQCTVLISTETQLFLISFYRIRPSFADTCNFFFLSNTLLCIKVMSFMTSVEMLVCDFRESALPIAHSCTTVTDAAVLMTFNILHVALEAPWKHERSRITSIFQQRAKASAETVDYNSSIW